MFYQRFEQIRDLGRGASGIAILVKDHENNDNEVVLKVLHEKTPESRWRFRHEAKTLIALRQNPNVINIIEDHSDLWKPFIILEHCQLGNLRQYIGRLQWPETCKMLANAAFGLWGVHHIGGIHRDVNPNNLLSVLIETGEQIIVICDFGVSRFPRPITNTPMTYSLKGTPGYIAPEVLAGHRFTPAADIFSLGTSGIVLMTGSTDRNSVISPSPWKNINLEFKQLLWWMTDNQPENRPTIEVVYSELQTIIENNKNPINAFVNDIRSLFG